MIAVEADAQARPFWDGVERGELRLQRCGGCGQAVFSPRAVCSECSAGRLDWFTARGTGTVHGCAVAHRAVGAFAAQDPFTVALVDLDEGVRMMTRIVESAEVDIGDRVELRATRLGSAGAPVLPCFRVTGRRTG